MELAELMQGQLRIQDGPLQQPGGVGGGGYFHPRPVPPNSMNLNPPVVGGSGGIHSAPVFSTNSAESAASTPGGDSQQHLSHRYTFPMAVLPQSHHMKSSRTHIHTEHHHLSSTLAPPTPALAGGMGGATTGGGGGAFQGIPPPSHSHEVGGDPNVMYSLQHQVQQTTIPGRFMPRDSWHYPPPPTAGATTPHELHPHHSHGSLMQAQAGFYPPPPNQQGGAQLQPPPPPDPPGYNSRAPGNTAGETSHRPLQPHSMGPSVVSVPCTHTSPYHHHHQSQPQPPHLVPDLQQHQHRHHSVDYGLHPQNISPHRKRSYSNDVHKQPNGHLPQATSSPALMVAAGAGGGGGGGGPYNYDYPAIPPGTSAGAGGSGRPNFHAHQSSSGFYAHSAHLPPPPSSAPTHYNHRLPAVSEGTSVNMDVFQKLSVLFPGCDDRIWSVMTANPRVLEIEKLVPLIQQ